MQWCLVILLLFGMTGVGIYYLVNAVHEACRAGFWSQQQENERTMRMFEQQE